MTVYVEADMEQELRAEHPEYVQRCRQLQQQYRAYTATATEVAIKKDNSNLFRHRQQPKSRLDMRAFNHVLMIDDVNGLIEAEGFITFDALVTHSLKHHFLPAVVPELKSITVGGALTGIGIESSSFRFGLVHETIVEFDVLLASGDIVTCRADNEYSDLFFAFPNSYGTLGYALRVVLKLIPAKAYVALRHRQFNDPQSYFKKLTTLCLDNHKEGKLDYIEGVIFNRNDMVITTAKLVAHAPYVHDYTHMHIYYKSLQNRQTDYLSVCDYIWRWDTDWFWCSKVFGAQNPLVRLLLGRRFLKSTTYRKIMRFMHHNKLAKWCVGKRSTPSESVIQDVVIPADKAHEFFQFFIEQISLRPFWICPTMRYGDAEYTLFELTPGTLYFNFGFWGMVESDKPAGYYNKLIEQKVVELGGLKSLYSDVYYSEAEFWNIFNKKHFDALKSKYDRNGRFKDLYNKVVS
ncbi:MAG: FAD-linked oxidase [Coxiella sp. (in: Bacteria)]|nr:MAG: FAD-linked oxidase [Coxiella sp. (in: g-proteobacteria)]